MKGSLMYAEDTEPTARVTVQGELDSLFNLLVKTGGEISALEEVVIPIAHAGGVAGMAEDEAQPPQPEVIKAIRGMISSVKTYNLRLETLRGRLAL